MGFIAPIAAFADSIAPIVGVLGGAASIYGAVSGGKTPKAPAPVQAATPVSEIETAERSAADKARRRAQAAAASQSTILTGPTGLTSKPRTILG